VRRPQAVLLTTLVAAVAATPAQAATPRDSLYIQHAASGTLSGGKLVLRGVARRTVRFDDRPGRTWGAMPVTSFVRGWRSSFAGAPPNAALVVNDAPANRDVALLELRRPRLDATRRTLTFTVRRLRQTGSERLQGFARRADSGVARFGSAELLIDPSAAAPQIAAVNVNVPPAQILELTFTNTTVAYFPPRDPSQTNIDTGGGLGGTVLRPSSMTFGSSGGRFGFSITTLVVVAPPAGGAVTGTASIPDGGQVTFIFAGENPQSLSNGPFSVPFPASSK
jgi:hypothetical protein